MHKVELDFETYSEAGYVYDPETKKWKSKVKNKTGIAVAGTFRYAAHPSTHIWCVAYRLNGWKLWVPGMPPPTDLFEYINQGGIVEAHNSLFEFAIWHYQCHWKLGWPPLPLHQLRCSMAKCLAWGLPGKLAKIPEALGSSEEKDPAGKRLITKLCTPKPPGKQPSPAANPRDFDRLYAYCLQDIKTEHSISEQVPNLNPTEQNLWLLDQQINTRGVAIDTGSLDNCVSIVERAIERHTQELYNITGGQVGSISEVQKMVNWLCDKGCPTSSVDEETVEKLLSMSWISSECRRVLEIRQLIGGSSVKKLYAMKNQVCHDGRLRGLFQYCGADRTGRFAGRGPQPQNLKTKGPDAQQCGWCGVIHAKETSCCPGAPQRDLGWSIEAATAALDDIATRNLDLVTPRWGSPISVVAGCLRSLFIAREGYDLVNSDYNSIEAVVLAALAGEEWRLEVFRGHGKIYETSASAITGIPLEEFFEYKRENGDHHPLRNKIGKVAELASGFQGSVGAWKQFGAGNYFTDEEILKHVKAWRKASPAIVDLWYGLENAAKNAISIPGREFRYRYLTYFVQGNVLYCRLPSGRHLAYHKPRIEPGKDYFGRPVQKITFMKFSKTPINGKSGWIRVDTYGGKLTENCTQAVARDILTHAMPKLEMAGYPIVLHVHDEATSEVPKGFGSVEEYEKIMMDRPDWCRDWPIRASGGWRGERFRK